MKPFTLLILLSAMCLSLYAQKLNIAVADFENKSEYPHSIAPIRDMITNELFKSGKFSIFEREKMGVLIKEKQLADSGLVEGIYREKFKGVDAIVYGSVTGFGVKSETKGGLGGTFQWGLLGGGKKDTVEVRIHLRIIDVNTGEILGSSEAVGRRYWKKGIGLGLFSGIPVVWGSGGFDNTMIGMATRLAVTDAVRIIESTTAPLYSRIRSEEKIQNRFADRYPAVQESSPAVSSERQFKVSNEKRNLVIFVSIAEKNLDYPVLDSVVSSRLVSSLKEDGYPVTSDRKKASVLIEGSAESFYVATVFDRLSDSADYKSASAKVNLKMINLTNGDMIDTFSFTLPKPRLHVRTELAGEKALQELGNLVSNQIPLILDRSEITLADRKKALPVAKSGEQSYSRVELTLQNIKDFKSLADLKKWLIGQKFFPTVDTADFDSGQIVISVKNTNTFELAEALSGFGYTIVNLSDRKLTAKK